jgi:DNA-directed RNA polymerase subunit L
MTAFEGIIKFNKDRNLLTFNCETEYNCLFEELQEFLVAENVDEQVDALCDIMVFAVGALFKLGYDPEKALSETVKEISSRQGSLNENTGKWEKDKEQDLSTLYKADYRTAKEGT